MRTFRNLTYAFVVLCSVSMGLVIFLSLPSESFLAPAFLNVNSAIFAVALVALVASLFMYFHSKNAQIVVLKRRGSRCYGELLEHKMRLIDVMDGAKSLADWERILYSPEEFFRIKKFLYEEYFLLLNYEPFLGKSPATASVQAFYDMHKELDTFMRSVDYDRLEYNRYRRAYTEVWGQEVTRDTPEENLTRPELKEAYDALILANEYALFNVDHLLTVLDGQLTKLDKYFTVGVPWSTGKASYDAEFRLWMHNKD